MNRHYSHPQVSDRPCRELSIAARVVESAGRALRRLEDSSFQAIIEKPIERGYFNPSEQEKLRDWFVRFLTARQALQECVEELRHEAMFHGHHRVFAVVYPAACAMVRAARFLVTTMAVDRVVQRKLNEAVPEYHIPKKSFTNIRRSLTSPRNAWHLLHAKQFAVETREELQLLADDPEIGPAASLIPDVESAIDVNPREWLFGRLRYRLHGFRRRNKVAAERAFFAIAEASGRLLSCIKRSGLPALNKEMRLRIVDLLEAGDVVITRHDGVATNLFLPGYWPHASLFVRNGQFLEARKDGVRLRFPEDTLAVDAVVVLRPRLEQSDIEEGIDRAMQHEGKLYNFDFDFFTDDRLVCTEVVYRGYQGLGKIEFELSQRAGRPSLSAEDILNLALQDRYFDVVMMLSGQYTGGRLLQGKEAIKRLQDSVGTVR